MELDAPPPPTLTDLAQTHPDLLAECVGGALSVADLANLTLILCSDGVWDLWEYEDVFQSIVSPPDAAGKQTTRAAEEFFKRSVARGTEMFESTADNMTGVVVPPPCLEPSTDGRLPRAGMPPLLSKLVLARRGPASQIYLGETRTGSGQSPKSLGASPKSEGAISLAGAPASAVLPSRSLSPLSPPAPVGAAGGGAAGAAGSGAAGGGAAGSGAAGSGAAAERGVAVPISPLSSVKSFG